MNCLDITRIANSGNFAQLPAAERLAAEGHARTCRHCAPTWAAHAHLAGLHTPVMPATLASRCRSAAAAAGQQKGYPWQRLTLIGGVVALAAAAAWIWSVGRAMPPAPATSIASPAPSEIQAGSASDRALPASNGEVTPIVPETQTAAEVPQAAGKLPLVPPPRGSIPDPAKLNLALQRAVERHPELVQGPPLDDEAMFVAAVALRADGSVLDSAAELTSPATFTATADRVPRLLPMEGEHLGSLFEKGHQTAGGGLRARLLLRGAMFPEGFDSTRSELRVREILGRLYDDHMLPSSAEEVGLLTVFLSDDGRILREKVERAPLQEAALVLGIGSSTRLEEAIALKLGIGVTEMGLVGSTRLEQGSMDVVVEANGTRRVEGVRRLPVRYAWARRPGEPSLAEAPAPADTPLEDFDRAAALVVVERLLPDAFSHAPPTVAELMFRPVVVFTARGEVLRAGRVQVRNGVDTDSLLQEQLVPGVPTRLHRAVRLTNKAGATALVELAWAE